ncbi:MAG TPA: GreA/GreB family elongation factor [Bradyrhizobium sp.]|nr:GreA/GreB family elongation factor [Bradyrhizobium sp.]
MLPLPNIAITASDHVRLERLARVARHQGNLDALFLMGEINRAEIVADDVKDVALLVKMESWVTYRTNWGVPSKTAQLVWPEDRGFDLARISVLSPLGAALIGLRVGDQMPYFVGAGLNVVTIEGVGRSPPNVVPLFRPPASAKAGPSDDDPGPTAA